MGNNKIKDIDKALRPNSFNEFVGQKKFIDNLKIYIAGAKNRKEVLDHCLFSGSAGLGKTTLSYIIAKEFGYRFYSVVAGVLNEPIDLAAYLVNNSAPFILFLDEIHRLKKPIEEMLYKAMEDGSIDVKFSGNRVKTYPVKPFTLIGATTRTGLISDPLRDRFQIKYCFEEYNEQEIESIINRSSKLLGFEITKDGQEALARVCRGVPRIANGIVRRLRDFLPGKIADINTVYKTMESLEIDETGLNKIDLNLLNYLIKNGNAPVGLKNLAVILGEEPDTIEEVIEPFLIKRGLLQRTSKGRIVTDLAYDYLGIDPIDNFIKEDL